MPRLAPVLRPPAPPEGYDPCPVDPDWDRLYILNAEGEPERVYDFGIHARWTSWEGKAYQIRDLLPEFNAEIWTYFSGWASMHDDKPPRFRTTLRAGGIKKTFESATWEEAEDKHRRVLEKVQRVIPKRDSSPQCQTAPDTEGDPLT